MIEVGCPWCNKLNPVEAICFDQEYVETTVSVYWECKHCNKWFVIEINLVPVGVNRVEMCSSCEVYFNVNDVNQETGMCGYCYKQNQNMAYVVGWSDY